MTSCRPWARIAGVKDRTTTIGLTGDVGTGKSTVLSWLARHGVAVLDADRVVHDLLGSSTGLSEAIVVEFGNQVLVAGSRAIDRQALATIVFADDRALARLESLVHPAAIDAVGSWLEDVREPVAAVEAVKLVESGMAGQFDHVWLVICDTEMRRQRLVLRGWSPEEVDRRIRAGTPLGPRLAAADQVIDNSGTAEDTARQLTRAFDKIVSRAEGDAI